MYNMKITLMRHRTIQKSLIKLLIACFIVPCIGLNPSYAINEVPQDVIVAEKKFSKNNLWENKFL